MRSFEFDRPPLATLQRRPSWCNRAGRVDRSACLELDVRQLWRRVFDDSWRCAPTPRASGCIARAQITIDADDLDALMDRRKPRELIGDFRTPKSNAMKSPRDPQRRRRLKPHDVRWFAMDNPDWIPFGNPNRGAGASKHHGFALGPDPTPGPGSWQQTIHIERRIRRARTSSCGSISESRAACSRHDAPRRGAPARTRTSGLAPSQSARPNHQHYLICPKCARAVRKLFAILATPDELRDARIAQQWLALSDQVPQRLLSEPQRRQLRDLRLQLISRYAPLFNASANQFTAEHAEHAEKESRMKSRALRDLRDLRGEARRFLCRHCLHIRYGEVKKSRRNEFISRGDRPLTARQWMAPFIARPPLHRDKPLYLSNAPKPRNSPRKRTRLTTEAQMAPRIFLDGTAEKDKRTRIAKKDASENAIGVHPRSSAAPSSAAGRAQAHWAAELAAAHQAMVLKVQAEAFKLEEELRAEGIDVDRLLPPLPTTSGISGISGIAAAVEAAPHPGRGVPRCRRGPRARRRRRALCTPRRAQRQRRLKPRASSKSRNRPRVRERAAI